MAQTPFYKVILQKTGRDISDLFSKLSHEMAVDEDSLVTLDFQNGDPQLVDDSDMKEGELILFSYGYLGGISSGVFQGKISSVIAYYGANMQVILKATDLGIVMKKNQSKKIWKNITASSIARQIADANGLTAVVDNTTKIYPAMPQGNRTDYQFLKYLAHIEKDGSWRFYILGNELHFTRLALEKLSFKTYEYMAGDSTIKSFRPYSEELLKKTAATNTVITTVDPFTNKPVQNVINDSTAKDDVKLGKFVYDFNANQIGKIAGTSTGTAADPTKAGKNIFSPDPNDATNIGNKIKKTAALDDYKASLTLEGDPDLRPDEIITMGGAIAKKDTGNWYVKKVANVVDPGVGYETRATLIKNAGKKPIGDNTPQKNVNSSSGDKTKTQKKAVTFFYNEDGNLIGIK